MPPEDFIFGASLDGLKRLLTVGSNGCACSSESVESPATDIRDQAGQTSQKRRDSDPNASALHPCQDSGDGIVLRLNGRTRGKPKIGSPGQAD